MMMNSSLRDIEVTGTRGYEVSRNPAVLCPSVTYWCPLEVFEKRKGRAEFHEGVQPFSVAFVFPAKPCDDEHEKNLL